MLKKDRALFNEGAELEIFRNIMTGSFLLILGNPKG
jgi:hypothetical protein